MAVSQRMEAVALSSRRTCGLFLLALTVDTFFFGGAKRRQGLGVRVPVKSGTWSDRVDGRFVRVAALGTAVLPAGGDVAVGGRRARTQARAVDIMVYSRGPVRAHRHVWDADVRAGPLVYG